MMKVMFMFILIFSVLFSLSSNNMMMIWMGLEMNMLSFIPLLMKKFNYKMNSLLYMKYFMIQSVASMMFFMLIIMFMMTKYFNTLLYIILINSMMMKLGMPPYYLWYTNIMKAISWIMCIILSTIQKIIPLYVLIKFLNFHYWMILLIIFSSTLSTYMGLKQSLLKLMMAFSSLNHMSWMIMLIMLNENFMIKYYIIYSVISSKLMFMFKIYNMISLNDLFQLKENKFIKLLFLLNILSLGGMPPFMGFILKWYSLVNLYTMNLLVLLSIVILMINATFTLLYYINIILPILFLYSNKKKMFLNKNNYMNFIFTTSMFSSIYMLMFNSLM